MKEYILGVFVLLQVWIISTEKCEEGNRQSPINILTNTARYQEFRPFKLENYEKYSMRKGTLKAKNTGTSLKLYATGEQKRPILTGGPLNVPYEFVEMHFHWGENASRTGSEHTFDGRSYPLELHMVHKNIHDEKLEDALAHEDGLTVLGFKFEFVDDKKQNNIAIDTLTELAKEHLQSASDDVYAKKKQLPAGKDVAVVNFLPFLMDEYFHYTGSLTTGACDEAVNWIVFKLPLSVHKDNMWDLQTLLNKEGKPVINNFRPVQLMNDRPLYYHGTHELEKGTIQKKSSKTARSHQAPHNEDYLLTVPYNMLLQTATLAEWPYKESKQSLMQKVEARQLNDNTPARGVECINVVPEHLQERLTKLENLHNSAVINSVQHVFKGLVLVVLAMFYF